MDPDICQHGRCDNTPGSFGCKCDPGYSVKSSSGPGCTDDDECEIGSFRCDINARCINIEGTHECECLKGFSGNKKS